MKTGIAILPLHYGTTPRWLFERMKKLGKAIASLIIREYGSFELLKRIADPFWFQAFGCTLGFDWHSSGLTTVTCGALKEALREAAKENEINIGIAGGKGKAAKKTLAEIENKACELNLTTKKIERLIYASRMAAKVDSAVLQDMHELYHHTFIFTVDGRWAVIQQGMDIAERTARRYHWLSENVESFVNEAETILSQIKHRSVLDMRAEKSEEARKCCLDLIREKPTKLKKELEKIRRESQKTLDEWLNTTNIETQKEKEAIKVLRMPRRINWKVVKALYEFQPKNYEELISFEGVGPSLVRALALISALIYGNEPSWKDPVKYSFAVGGKDGVPFPVNKKVMDKSIAILEDGIKEAELGKKEKLLALKRLKWFVENSR